MSQQQILSNIQNFIETKNKKGFDKFLNELDDSYFNSTSNIDDEVYDIIVGIYEKHFGKRKKVGAKVKKNRVKLPYMMGSLEKIYDSHKLSNWTKNYRGPYIVSSKADGISGCLIEEKGTLKHLYTRGDGEYGEDISKVIKYIFEKYNIKCNNFTVRGEIIISKQNWIKYEKQFSNPRNLVSAVMSKKEYNTNDIKILRDLDFLAYEILNPRTYKISEQMDILSKNGYKTVNNLCIDTLDVKKLSTILNDSKQMDAYNIDGIVIVDDSKSYKNNDTHYPKWARAYKESNIIFESTVTDIEWNISTINSYRPKVLYKPVEIDGTIYSKATGHNASYIKKNGIGKGSVIKIVIAGDIIPNVLEVVKKTDPLPSFPKDYVWGDGVERSSCDIFATTKTKESEIKKISKFFSRSSGLDIQGIGGKTIEKMYNSGLDSYTKILNATIDDFKKANLGEVNSKNIWTNIQEKLNNPIDLYVIMGCSQLLGDGINKKTCQKILEIYPDILTNTPSNINENKVKGLGQKTLDLFLKNLPEFKKFLAENSKIKIKSSVDVKKTNGGKLINKVFVLSGIFSVKKKEIEEYIKSNGGEVKTSVTSKVNYVVNDDNSNSSKVKKGRELGISIITYSDLLKL